MEENPEQNLPKDDLTFNDTVAFLRAAKVSAICPACGNGSWELTVNVSDQDTMKHPTLQMTDAQGNIFLGGVQLPLVTAMCKRCGLIRSHARNLIKKWVQEGKVKDILPNVE